MSRSATEDLFHRYHAAWANHDPDAIVAMHSEDSVFHLHSGQEPAVGRAAIRESAAATFALVPDLAWEELSLRVGDDYWVVEWRMSGTTSAGAPVKVDLVDVVSLKDGLVAGKHSYVDGAAMQAALDPAGATA